MRTRAANITKNLLVCLLAGVMAFCILTPTASFATPAEEKQKEAEAAADKLEELQAELDVASDNYNTALADLEAAKAKVAEAQARIDEATARIQELQVKLGTRARSMYRSGSITALDLILGASTFQEFATSWDLLNQLNENDAEMVAETKALREEVKAQKIELDKQAEIAAQKEAEAKKIQEEAQALVDDMQATVDALSEEAAELLAQEQAAREAAASSAASATYDDPPYNPATGNAVVDRAYSCLGCPYEWASCGPGSYDCSGLVGYCLTGSHSRVCTSSTFASYPAVSDPQPGDVCYKPGHVGIYIGGGQMIHAPQEGDVVRVSAVQGGMKIVRW